MGPKVGCFVAFCHHHLVNTGVHTQACCYYLFQSGMKIGLWTIVSSRNDNTLLCKHKEQQWNRLLLQKWFPAKYLWFLLLHRPFTLWNLYITHCSMLSTSCVDATGCSIRYYNRPKWVPFCLINCWPRLCDILAIPAILS